jgi:hypothetical protein
VEEKADSDSSDEEVSSTTGVGNGGNKSGNKSKDEGNDESSRGRRFRARFRGGRGRFTGEGLEEGSEKKAVNVKV